MRSNQWLWSGMFATFVAAALYGATVEPGWEWFLTIPVFLVCGWLAGLPGFAVITKRGIWRWSGLIRRDRIVAAGWAIGSSGYSGRNWVPVLGVTSMNRLSSRWVVLRELRRSDRGLKGRHGLMRALTDGGQTPMVDLPAELRVSLW